MNQSSNFRCTYNTYSRMRNVGCFTGRRTSGTQKFKSSISKMLELEGKLN
jgi:hypothetical protein